MRTLYCFLLAFLSSCSANSLNGLMHDLLPSGLSERHIMNAVDAKDGKVKLRNRKNSLVAKIDLQDFKAPNTKRSKGSDVYALLSLYNNETFFVDNKCLGFSSYDCAANHCIEHKDDKVTLNDPFYKGNGYTIKAQAVLDYENWRVFNENPILLLNDCKDNFNFPETENTHGMIGLGTSGNARKNFAPEVKSFMIKFDDNNAASLVFNPQVNVDEEGIDLKLKCDDDWRVKGINAISVINREFHLSLNLLFDTNTEGISLPLNVFKKVIKILARKGIECKGPSHDSMSNAICQKTGLVRDLPIIYILSGDTQLPIYPQIYVKNGKSNENKTVSEFTLNIKGLSSAKQDDHISHRFNNYIILGDSFLAYYDTVFDLENKEIRISGPKSHQASEDKAKTIVRVIVVCAILVLVLYGLYIAYMRMKARQLNQAMDDEKLLQEKEGEKPGFFKSLTRMLSKKSSNSSN